MKNEVMKVLGFSPSAFKPFNLHVNPGTVIPQTSDQERFDPVRMHHAFAR